MIRTSAWEYIFADASAAESPACGILDQLVSHDIRIGRVPEQVWKRGDDLLDAHRAVLDLPSEGLHRLTRPAPADDHVEPNPAGRCDRSSGFCSVPAASAICGLLMFRIGGFGLDRAVDIARALMLSVICKVLPAAT